MDFALLLQVLPSADAGHAFSKLSRAVLQNSLFPFGETVSSCEIPAEPEGATQLNCCLLESHTGFISGFAHCPKALIERIDSVDSITYVRTFIEASHGKRCASRIDCSEFLPHSRPVQLDAKSGFHGMLLGVLT